MSRSPDLLRRRRVEAVQQLRRWLHFTSPPPSPLDVITLLDWVDDLVAENKGLRQDLLASIERKLPA